MRTIEHCDASRGRVVDASIESTPPATPREFGLYTNDILGDVQKILNDFRATLYNYKFYDLTQSWPG